VKKRDEPLAALPDPVVRALLSRLHAKADRETPKLVWRFASQGPRLLFGRKLPWDRLATRLNDAFIPLDRTQGAFCYLLARALGARRIVEFGTSYGISTIYLACAVRDNGGGLVIGTERVSSKAEKARDHLREAGLEEYVEIREGDALETLRDLEGPIDFMLNDGFPPYALPILELVSPQLRLGAVVVADNVGAFKADHAEYLEYVRNPTNGFCSGFLKMNEGSEFSVRVASPR
jgi:predicted O-methyltransferase YrrM